SSEWQIRTECCREVANIAAARDQIAQYIARECTGAGRDDLRIGHPAAGYAGWRWRWEIASCRHCAQLRDLDAGRTERTWRQSFGTVWRADACLVISSDWRSVLPRSHWCFCRSLARQRDLHLAWRPRGARRSKPTGSDR